MPALAPVAKVVRVDHHWSAAADPNMQIRNFFQYSGTLSTTDATTWLSNITTAMGVFTVNRLGNPYNLVLSVLTDLTSTSAPQVSNSTGATGTAGANTLPAGSAFVIRHHIVRRTRGGHSRVYIPGQLSTNLVTVTEWTNAWIAAIVADYITYINACTANTNPAAIGTITHVSVSYFQGFTNHTYPSGRVKPIPTPRSTPLVDTIVNIAGNATPGSQRRRNEQP